MHIPIITNNKIGLFLTSFCILFLELLLIRWVAAIVPIVAYYGNILLISSFLGIGISFIFLQKKNNYQFFYLSFALLIVIIFSLSKIPFSQGGQELILPDPVGTSPIWIILIFLSNTILFFTLGNNLVRFFKAVTPIEAYIWDLLGAITGVIFFGIFSFFHFSPLIGFGLILILFLFLAPVNKGGRLTSISISIGIMISIFLMTGKVLWSPYNQLAVKQINDAGVAQTVTEPESLLKLRIDPALYIVEVNKDFYMMAGSINPARYTDKEQIKGLFEQYTLPYRTVPAPSSVLIIAGGGGMDIEGAVLSNAKHIDVVEIDPQIIAIGKEYNASNVYLNSNVTVFNDDARAYLNKTNSTYDVIVFGFLDSRGLFSSMANIRLDGYVYTEENFHKAYTQLNDGGLLSISFFAGGKFWIVDKIAKMLQDATGVTPSIFYNSSGQVIFLAGKGFVPEIKEKNLSSYQKLSWQYLGTKKATDNWPYLYLMKNTIPLNYIVVIVLLLACLFGFYLGRKEIIKKFNYGSFFLGATFFLLETIMIKKISLYFGTTWIVNMVTFLGVLLMVLFANLIVAKNIRIKNTISISISLFFIIILFIFPWSILLGQSMIVKFLFSILIVPLPLFFNSLTFSCMLKQEKQTLKLFGANLLGVAVGGFSEYFSMILGVKALFIVAAVFTFIVLMFHLVGKKVLLPQNS